MDFTTRDPFVEMLEEKERGEERAFFGRRDRELIERVRAERRRAEEMAVRRSALARCPQCGVLLTKVVRHGVESQKCPQGHGFWVPAGVEQVRGRAEETAIRRTALGGCREPALGRCPRCGVLLAKGARRGVETRKCPEGHGFWVPPAALEKIRKREHDAWFDRYVHMRW